jgi:hypothetical protein
MIILQIAESEHKRNKRTKRNYNLFGGLIERHLNETNLLLIMSSGFKIGNKYLWKDFRSYREIEDGKNGGVG